MTGEDREIKEEYTTSFDDIVGQEPLKEYFQNAVRTERMANTYLISGAKGSGKSMMAEAFAAALLCEEKTCVPCGNCPACSKFRRRNHPDYIEIQHEKPKLISVEDVRSQLVEQIGYAPSEGEHRIFVIENAELMNPAAQNAILKSIEEPPAYAVIMLLTENLDSLLPTIRSRAVSLEMKPVRVEEIEKYLISKYALPDYHARVVSQFSQGNIGRALLLSESEDFRKRKEKVTRSIERIRKSPEYQIEEIIGDFLSEGGKENLDECLNLILIWYRDVLLYKATGSDRHIIYREEFAQVRRQAENESYQHLNKVLLEVKETQDRLKANMKAESALNLLFLRIKGDK